MYKRGNVCDPDYEICTNLHKKKKFHFLCLDIITDID